MQPALCLVLCVQHYGLRALAQLASRDMLCTLLLRMSGAQPELEKGDTLQEAVVHHRGRRLGPAGQQRLVPVQLALGYMREISASTCRKPLWTYLSS